MSDLLVTVAMPVYNAMPYLPMAVESILSQTYRDFRFLIINDGSTDGSAVYLDSLDDSRVEVIHQENRGAGLAANRSLELCDTLFYARMDADDISMPNRLALQAAYMLDNPNVVLVGGQIDFLIDGELLAKAPPLPLEHGEIVRGLMKKKPVVCQPSMMVRTAAARAVDGYRISNAGEDFDLFLRLGEIGRLANLPDRLLSYRIRLDSLSNSRRGEVNLGIAYAVHCAECRRDGRSEPVLNEFAEDWNRRGWISKARERADYCAKSNYRKGVISLGRGRRFHAALRFAAAAALRPRRALELMWSRCFGRIFVGKKSVCRNENQDNSQVNIERLNR